jgi:hypothetical protein
MSVLARAAISITIALLFGFSPARAGHVLSYTVRDVKHPLRDPVLFLT